MWLDERGRRPDPAVAPLLEAPYDKFGVERKGRDYNLNRERIGWLHEFIPRDALGGVWEETARAAVERIHSSQEITDASRAAVENARRDLRVRLRQLDIRRARVTGAELEQLDREVRAVSQMWQRLIEALAKPALALDSTGVVVVSAQVPDQEAASAG